MNLSKKSAKENSLNVFSLYHILKGTECNKSQKSSIKNDFFFQVLAVLCQQTAMVADWT